MATASSRTKKLVYAKLPSMNSDLGFYCTSGSCKGHLDFAQVETDEGRKLVRKCRVCGKKHRPDFKKR